MRMSDTDAATPLSSVVVVSSVPISRAFRTADYPLQCSRSRPPPDSQPLRPDNWKQPVFDPQKLCPSSSHQGNEKEKPHPSMALAIAGTSGAAPLCMPCHREGCLDSGACIWHPSSYLGTV
ncbi:hypothetical protein LX36DRAFT_659456 [Colletotrichum falcatum]|nr:hypothetical protein LX36DRAFT_659456 [Colletotrichum falcatum]